MHLWTTFILGLAGSLHCAGMCGPLVLAMPAVGHSATSRMLGRVAYNAGRVGTYTLMGAISGVIGGTFAWAGISRWVSIACGALLLASVLGTARQRMHPLVTRWTGGVRTRLGYFLRRRGWVAGMALGAGNGLLPCGLVYAAVAVAVTSGGLLAGAADMLTFGLGTVPMMLGIGLGGLKLQMALRTRFQAAIPVCLVVTGLLLILRGMALGIPFLSPAAAATGAHCPLCHL